MEIVGRSNFFQEDTARINTGFRTRVQSTGHLKVYGSSKSSEKRQNFTIPKQSSNCLSTKSYSKILNELSSKKKSSMIMNPIRHSENPLFKKIKKINKMLKIQEDGSFN